MKMRTRTHPCPVTMCSKTRILQRMPFPAIFAFSIVLLVTSGCEIHKRHPSDVKYFLLDVQRAKSAATVKKETCLRIRPCQMAASFAGRSLVYRTSTVLYEPDYYNLFLTNPDAQVTDAMRSWFRQAGFGECVSAETSDTVKYTLEPRVEMFCADFTPKDNPTAVVQMHVLVTTLDKSCSCIKTVLDQTYTAQTLLPVKPAAAQVVEGLSTSLSKILQQMESDLVRAM